MPALRTAAFAGSIAAVGILGAVFKSDLPHATCAPCDPARLWAMDRAILGPVRGGPGHLSDATLLASVAGAAIGLGARSGERGVRGDDLAVLATTLSVSSTATVWTKVLFHRPRPVLYGPDAAQHRTPDNGLAFPSGHAMLAFAAAAGYASIAHRHGELGRRRTVAVALFSAAAATATLRVVARRHFPTDVIAGAVLGTGIGWVVPALWPAQ